MADIFERVQETKTTVPDQGPRGVYSELASDNFEELLGDLSGSFIRAAAEAIDDEIELWLQRIALCLALDRGTLTQFDSSDGGLWVTHQWALNGIPTPDRGLNLRQHLPWLAEQIASDKPVVYSNLPHGLPREAVRERQFVEIERVKAHITLPLKIGGNVVGGLSFATLHYARSWSEKDVRRLRLVAEVFGNALERKRVFAEHRRLVSQAAASLKNAQLCVDLPQENSERRKAEEEAALAHELNQPLGAIRSNAHLHAENLYLQDEVRLTHNFEEIVGNSAGIRRVFSQIEQVASTDATVLIIGETGTGKELVARAIHARSGKRQHAMVKVNCAALPASLIESELFGHEKGAFTGALTRVVGRFELANNGTIFLDEVGDLPLELQSKLLRVLQEGEFERLGSTTTIKVNVRLLAATNRNLEKLIDNGSFRADLYYRLNVFPIEVPPLRERRDDIVLLVWYFLTKHRGSLGKIVDTIGQRDMSALRSYSWPGNVRELENRIERALIGSTGRVLAIEGSQLGFVPPSAHPNSEGLDDVQRAHITAVLELCDWKVKGKGNAADRLGLNSSTLRARMKHLGIMRPNPSS